LKTKLALATQADKYKRYRKICGYLTPKNGKTKTPEDKPTKLEHQLKNNTPQK